jgi:hypothetical protein
LRWLVQSSESGAKGEGKLRFSRREAYTYAREDLK